MMYALQNKLAPGPREALSLLFEAISRMWAKSFNRSELPKLKALLHKALLMTSIHFPGAQHDIIQHLMHHTVDSIEANGPPWSSAMWPFERLWHVLISKNHCTKHPATSMMMSWRAERMADRLCEMIAAHMRLSDPTQVSFQLSAFSFQLCSICLYLNLPGVAMREEAQRALDLSHPDFAMAIAHAYMHLYRKLHVCLHSMGLLHKLV